MFVFNLIKKLNLSKLFKVEVRGVLSNKIVFGWRGGTIDRNGETSCMNTYKLIRKKIIFNS